MLVSSKDEDYFSYWYCLCLLFRQGSLHSSHLPITGKLAKLENLKFEYELGLDATLVQRHGYNSEDKTKPVDSYKAKKSG
mmetsp:Transcript_23475/g.35372  ORF Transcript_23475/g.35372 Transcript_23475/m.35372 type:complete len:80 (+) Transcript_23475:7-246(+)